MSYSRSRLVHRPDTRVSRRTALQGAGAIGLAASIALPKEVFAHSQAATPSDSDYPEVVITAKEFAFDMPATIEGGFTKVTMDNAGEMDHHAIFLRVNDDSTVEAVEEALALPEFGPVFAVSTAVGGPNCGPGQSTSVIIDLQPGQYLVICAIPNSDGVPHYALGMLSHVEVTEGSAAGTAPTADMTVHLKDFAFHEMPMDVPAGMSTWEIINEGPQLHEIVLNKLAEGVSFDMVMEMLSEPPGGSPEASPDAAQASPPMDMEMAAPWETLDGVAPMGAAVTNWLLADLEAGDYFAICFIPDSETGAPHFALGMVMPCTVS
jgi:uncharacterized cupredoxin-like copper-binding protein